ncbi:hypothetical protein [Lactobacillus gasseri]|uniref:hypothetical protein n=1 Tax=Lactobacillus gasseri TaxID=1596 RepID=UPI0022E2925D|nr:hypothetical protein [Lactobacillus gasseri]
MECSKGYSYGPTTLKNGKGRVNWGGVVSSTINNMANSAATGFISGGRGWPR